MTGERWRKIFEKDNDGRVMPVWKRGDYVIAANVAVWEDGALVRWDYELLVVVKGQERYVSTHKSLQAAKDASRGFQKKSTGL